MVAVALPPGPAWLALVREVWDSGAALLPVDHRLPVGETRALLDRARPSVLVTSDGWERRADGLPAGSDVALIVPTSGTGGEPKLAQFDRAALDAAVAASARALEATSGDRWLGCLPLAHIGGLLVLLRGVLLGAPVIVHASFDPVAVAAVRDVAFTSVVPTMLVRLLAAGADLSGFRAILVGGAHLPRDVRERARAAGAHLVETYGLTESCGGVVYEGLPLPGVRMRVDPEDGIELAGPMMLGYRFDPESTARAFTEDGWLRTGDTGEIGPQGRLRVIGRVDDLINSGGEKVWPHEVEAALRTHPKVGDVLVRGRPDPEWGQRVVAWVVAADPADPPTLEELRTHAAHRLARHKVPRELVPVQALPRTAVGKTRTAGLPDRE